MEKELQGEKPHGKETKWEIRLEGPDYPGPFDSL